MQQCAVYILYFTANLLYMFRVPFTPLIRSTGNCSRRPLVQVICRNWLGGAAGNALNSIHSQATTTLHHSQIKSQIKIMGVKGTRNMYNNFAVK
jgi:hypothetical protein